MSKQSLRPYVILLTLSLATQALALPAMRQTELHKPQPASEPGTIKSDDSQRIQKDALKRLDGLANSVGEIADPASRVRLQARIAESLWRRDEPRARQLFAQAYEDAINVQSPADAGQSG